MNDTANYEAHLFALQFNGDVVTGVLEDTGNSVQILNNGNASDETVVVNTLSIGSTTTTFQVGSAYGNSYTATTNVGYFKGNTAYQYDNYTNTGRTVTLGAGGDTYWLTPNCNVIGELEWLNTRGCYVTVVYENTATQRAVSTIYITTDPDNTPTDPTTPDPVQLVGMQMENNNLRIHLNCSNMVAADKTTFSSSLTSGTSSARIWLVDATNGVTVLNGVTVTGAPSMWDGSVLSDLSDVVVQVGASGIATGTSGRRYNVRVVLDIDGNGTGDYVYTGTNWGIL